MKNMFMGITNLIGGGTISAAITCALTYLDAACIALEKKSLYDK